MQFSMMSSENLSFIYNLNTSLQMREYLLRYAGTDRIKKSHYNINMSYGFFAKESTSEGFFEFRLFVFCENANFGQNSGEGTL